MCSAPLCFVSHPFQIYWNTPVCCLPGDRQMHWSGGSCMVALLMWGARGRTRGGSSGAEPTWMGCAFGWQHGPSTLVFAPAFCWHKSYLPEKHMMLMWEEKGSKAGEPKWLGCPPHLVSEIAAPRAVAKPAAHCCKIRPGVKQRCTSRSGCGSAGSFGVGTRGSRAAGAVTGAKLSALICLCESLPTAPAAFTFLQECICTVLTVLELMWLYNLVVSNHANIKLLQIHSFLQPVVLSSFALHLLVRHYYWVKFNYVCHLQFLWRVLHAGSEHTLYLRKIHAKT